MNMHKCDKCGDDDNSVEPQALDSLYDYLCHACFFNANSKKRKALTPAQRQQRRRDKKAKVGLVKVELFLTPQNAIKVRDYAASFK